MAATAKSDRVIADALESTAQISSLVRTTAVGVLAIAWGFLVTPSTRFPAPPPIIVLSVIALVISGLLVDWMQYVAAWLDSSARRRAMERDEELRGWNPNTFCYRCRTRCFVAKQVLVGLAAVLLVAGLAPSIIRLARTIRECTHQKPRRLQQALGREFMGRNGGARRRYRDRGASDRPGRLSA